MAIFLQVCIMYTTSLCVKYVSLFFALFSPAFCYFVLSLFLFCLKRKLRLLVTFKLASFVCCWFSLCIIINKNIYRYSKGLIFWFVAVFPLNPYKYSRLSTNRVKLNSPKASTTNDSCCFCLTNFAAFLLVWFVSVSFFFVCVYNKIIKTVSRSCCCKIKMEIIHFFQFSIINIV